MSALPALSLPTRMLADIMTGITFWFVTDSTASILSGAPVNAVLNIGFLLLFALPLRGTVQSPKQI